MKSDDIPADVMSAAQAVWADTKVISASLATDDDSDVLPYVIGRTADAIMAERKRCAKIALNKVSGEQTEYGGGGDAAAQRIHDDIMDGVTP